MRIFASLVAFAAIQLAAAGTIQRRASVNDVADLGYATLNGGTSGGSGGTQTTVTTLDQLTNAVSGDSKKIVLISGRISGSAVVRVGSNTSIIGKSGSLLDGIGLRVLEESNVIIRNVKISKVVADVGDAIGIQSAHQVWVDHVDLSSDMDHDKDFYDGLLDITHGCTGITVTNSRLHDHFKGSLVGHSDSNGSEDTPMTVTYANNWWHALNSRTPSFRFGHGHIFNNVFDATADGINTRDGAQLLVENNVWTNPAKQKPLYSTDGGFAVARGNDFGGGANEAPVGNFNSPPYSYSLQSTTTTRNNVPNTAGQNLGF